MIVLFGGHKGGVGKSTMLAHVAVALRLRTKKTIAVLNSDKNEGLKGWYERRVEEKLPLFTYTEDFGDIRKTIEKLNGQYDIVLVDTAGHDSQEFRSALACADIALFPIRPSSQIEIDSLGALTATVRKAQKDHNSKLQPLILLNRCVTQATNTDATEFSNMLSSDDYWIQPARQRISQLTSYEKMFNGGRGVHEGRDSKSKAQIELLCTELGIY